MKPSDSLILVSFSNSQTQHFFDSDFLKYLELEFITNIKKPPTLIQTHR